MEHQRPEQEQEQRDVQAPIPEAGGIHPNQTAGPSNVAPIYNVIQRLPPGTSLTPIQLDYLHSYEQLRHELQEELKSFWESQKKEVSETTNFKIHGLPTSRIKKVMKGDGDVSMVTAEAPIILGKACEMFIMELTLRSWMHTKLLKRRIIQRDDVARALARSDIYDFLVDIFNKNAE